MHALVPNQVNDDGIDSKALAVVKKRFLQVNEARLKRTLSALNPHQAVFFDSLPILLQVNHALLPGYVVNNTPCGISGFEPNRQQLLAVKNIARTYQYEPLADDVPRMIENVSMMGSCGTIAHSRASDMDFWISHDTNMAPSQLEALKMKLDRIQGWAESLGLEVYFFLMDAEQFRQGLRKGVSEEDCGTAQHYLLLDEFYRTSIFLAGRYPVWWLVPAELESRYDEFVTRLIDNRHIKSDECINFGGVSSIPAGEFIGAGMWQLYKGIESPYKSVIKIMLTELYASEYPEVHPLSVRFKQAIYAGHLNVNELDPYLMLYQRLADYLSNKKAFDRLELLRRCLYLKINEPLSRPEGRGTLLWRREAMRELVLGWGWKEQDYEPLDGRKLWKVHQVQQERKMLVNELNFSYRFLSRFARENRSAILIDEKDMNLLGRKLYAAFERKSGKIELINPNIAPNLIEEHITIVRIEPDPHSPKLANWTLYSGKLQQEALLENETIDMHIPIKEGRNILEMIVWCYLNGIVDASTHFTVFPGSTHLSVADIQKIINVLNASYPERMPSAPQEQYHQIALPKQLVLFINVGEDPLAELHSKGVYRLTDQTDPFNYSGLKKNLVLSIDCVEVNTWHEVLIHYYRQEGALVECLLNCIKQYQYLKLTNMIDIQVHCLSPNREKSISERVRSFFEELITRFCLSIEVVLCRFVLEMDQGFYLIEHQKKQVGGVFCASKSELMKKLSSSPCDLAAGGSGIETQFVELLFDRHALVKDVLPMLAQLNKPKELQVFFKRHPRVFQTIEVYFFDEIGLCISFQASHIQLSSYFNRLFEFFERINARSSLYQDSIKDPTTLLMSCYEVIGMSPLTLDKKNYHADKQDEYENKMIYSIKVLIQKKDQNSHYYTFYCNDIEFSEMKYGDGIFKAVAQYIQAKRSGFENYPIYITDLDVSAVGEELQYFSTGYFLQKKMALENLLNKAMAN